MKIFRHILAFCLLSASAHAFSAPEPISNPPDPNGPPPVLAEASQSPADEFEMFPIYPQLETVQGAKTVKTYQMPDWATRCQYVIKTNGRPLKATVELWTGPIRRTHQMQIDSEDGQQTPFQATLKFKKLAQVLKIMTSSTLEYPIQVGVSVPEPARAKELAENTERVWDNLTEDEKLLVQGGSTEGGGGAVRSWTIPTNVASVQFLGWSRDSSKKSFRAQIEVLQGPNNRKQVYTLQCGGGSQPYHAVIQTPGPGWMIRVTNKKFVEDGLVHFGVTPYEVVGDGPTDIKPYNVVQNSATSIDTRTRGKGNKQWWE